MTLPPMRDFWAVLFHVALVLAVLVVIALLVPPWMGTVFMFAAAVALIAAPFAYQWKSRGHWHRGGMGWHLMMYMGVFAAVMCLAVGGSIASGFRVPHSDLPDWTRPLVWEAVAIVAWWRLIVILRTDRDDA